MEFAPKSANGQTVTASQIVISQKAELLFYVHSASTSFPVEIRDEICRECGWSIPTYYRKLRSRGDISNAEFEKIVSVFSAKLDLLRIDSTSLSRILTEKKNNI